MYFVLKFYNMNLSNKNQIEITNYLKLNSISCTDQSRITRLIVASKDRNIDKRTKYNLSQNHNNRNFYLYTIDKLIN